MFGAIGDACKGSAIVLASVLTDTSATTATPVNVYDGANIGTCVERGDPGQCLVLLLLGWRMAGCSGRSVGVE